MIFSKCCNYIYRFFFDDSTPIPPSDLCYVFEFDLVDKNDRILSITYNGGLGVIDNINISLAGTETEADISNAIKSALNGVPITYEDVTVSRVDIGDDLFHYIIIFKNTSTDISILDIEGNATAATTTDCT